MMPAVHRNETLPATVMKLTYLGNTWRGIQRVVQRNDYIALNGTISQQIYTQDIFSGTSQQFELLQQGIMLVRNKTAADVFDTFQNKSEHQIISRSTIELLNHILHL